MNTTRTLPQLADQKFLTDGGLETWLIFDEGIDIPHFASFVLLDDAEAVSTMKRYYRNHLDIARRHGVGFVLESPTWRASQDWADLLGLDSQRLKTLTIKAIEMMLEIHDEAPVDQPTMVVSGNIGPRGDGYNPDFHMTAEEAEAYHSAQIETMVDAGAEMIGALTMTYTAEAIGITRAARKAGVPVSVSFTTETNGKLPDGTSLKDAIETVDAQTNDGPAYYMINCAHPSHFDHALEHGETWLQRVKGIRANASTMSHAELDNAEELDSGDPVDLGARYRELGNAMPELTIMGGCCGTDHKHIAAIAVACMAA
jgi:homocysteine S-methyltransferase